MLEHPYGLLSVLPPVVAIGLAMMTRRVITSLLVGVFVGALILAGWNPFLAGAETFRFLWTSLGNHDHLLVFGFTLLLGAMIGVVHKSGGMQGLVRALAPLATNRRRGQLTGWLLGLIIFFDDYANTLLLGTTMRPVTDRLRISREKLAYIVDSTAAPIAGIALVSTWIAAEVGFIQTGYEQTGLPAESYSAFDAFVRTIPYRFYPLWALWFVGLVAWTRRDFGPMLAAERRAAAGEGIGDTPDDLHESERLRPDETRPGHWHLAVLPVLLVIVVAAATLYVTGLRSKETASDASLWQIIGNGKSYLAMVFGSLAGLILAAVLAVGERRASGNEALRAGIVGAQIMLPALVVLCLAWSLSAQTEAPTVDDAGQLVMPGLDTGGYVAAVVESANIQTAWMPTMVFLLAAGVSFCTGTSWGTMAILTPLVIDTTYQLLTAGGAITGAYDPILMASVGSVLAGAIFGDHCSPISDTTVLSSRASGCNHMAHVWTQMPYALLVGGAAVLFGTIPVGFDVSVWILLPVGAIALFALLRVVGREP